MHLILYEFPTHTNKLANFPPTFLPFFTFYIPSSLQSFMWDKNKKHEDKKKERKKLLALCASLQTFNTYVYK